MITRRLPGECANGLTAAWLIAVMSMATSTRADDDDDVFGIAGNEQLLWVAATAADSEGKTPTIRFRCLKSMTAGFRHPDGVEPVTGRVGWLAAMGNVLHVVYEDGPQWSYTYREGLQPGEATGTQQVSARLPAPAKPWAWSPSAKQEAIYAVVPGSAAASLPSARRPPPATPEIKEANLPGSQPTSRNASTGLTQALQARPLAGAVARFAGGRWWRMENQLIPDWFDAHQQVWLAAGDETLHLLYRTADADAEIRHASRPIHPGASWSEPESIGVQSEASTAVAVMINKTLHFVYDEPDPNNARRIALRVARRNPRAWEAGPYLNDDDQRHFFDTDMSPVAVSSFGRDIGTAQRTEPHKIRVLFWDPRTGDHRADHDRTARLDLQPSSVIGMENARWLLLVTVTVLLMATLRRRQLARSRKDTPDAGD